MHYEILVEDQSGEKMLDTLMEKLKGSNDSYKIHSYKGCGTIPENLKIKSDPSKRNLLTQLPKLLSGFGKCYSGTPDIAIIVICDLDCRDNDKFMKELNDVLEQCHPKPNAKFCLAIEEGEAWLLGDMAAIRSVYPKAKTKVLGKYKNDSICGTWELLADAVYPGGSAALSTQPYFVIGTAKCEWATKITSKMNININLSPSFNHFKKTIKDSSST